MPICKHLKPVGDCPECGEPKPLTEAVLDAIVRELGPRIPMKNWGPLEPLDFPLSKNKASSKVKKATKARKVK